jgi:hypothetical protein
MNKIKFDWDRGLKFLRELLNIVATVFLSFALIVVVVGVGYYWAFGIGEPHVAIFLFKMFFFGGLMIMFRLLVDHVRNHRYKKLLKEYNSLKKPHTDLKEWIKKNDSSEVKK